MNKYASNINIRRSLKSTFDIFLAFLVALFSDIA